VGDIAALTPPAQSGAMVGSPPLLTAPRVSVHSYNLGEKADLGAGKVPSSD